MSAVARIDTTDMQRPLTAKELGAFYTDVQIADFLVKWAIRSGSDTVMDPSFGGGVFLRSASRQLLQMGGRPSTQVFGVELDQEVHARIADKLSDEFGVSRSNLLLSDFFAVDSTPDRLVDVIVGNPPFIRYHRFKGEVRKRALARAKAQGVRLTELSSSWAPFLVHSISMLKPGGRLAMVIPMELGHASYALPLLRHLSSSFREVRFLLFRKRLFPDLSEDTLLLLADDNGTHSAGFVIQEFAHAGLLDEQLKGEVSVAAHRMDTEAISSGKERLVEYLLPEKARELYQELKRSTLTARLGAIADVGIGYVSGANSFFHLRQEQIRLWGIPNDFLKPTISRGRCVSGLRFSTADWCRMLDAGEGIYLLHVPRDADLPDPVRKYVEMGEKQGVSKAYKCMVRTPWYSVPNVHRPDAFLSYMSGNMPYLVANDAGVVASNSLHLVRFHQGSAMDRDTLAALWHTSLTQLSTEIEGHAMGGGMLKLEPTEAENVVIALPEKPGTGQAVSSDCLDSLLRSGRESEAQQMVDNQFLRSGLGLSKRDCDLLRHAADSLRYRRQNRRTPA